MDRPLVTHVKFILKKGLNNGAEIEWDKKSADVKEISTKEYKILLVNQLLRDLEKGNFFHF